MQRRVIFVFGSNKAGRHGKGAALFAKENHGAVYGQAEGLQGDSYGVPTKDEKLRPLSLEEISANLKKFLEFASLHPDFLFVLTPVGAGLAGYKKSEILRLLRSYTVPANVALTSSWIQ